MAELYKTKDVNGLRLVKGKLPVGTKECGDTLLKWAKQGYTEACNDLAKIYKCDYVTGSLQAIDSARIKHKLKPRFIKK